MKIGIDARLTYYRTGGISTYIRRLVMALEALDTRNAYTVFHSRKAQDSLVSRFRRGVLWTPAHHRLERWALSAELARFGLDILHSPDFIPPQCGAKRHIITVHDLNFLYYPEFLTRESLRYYNDQIAWAVKHAAHILADSEATRQDMVRLLGVAPEQITVHMLGVDESFKPPTPEALATATRELALPDRYFLFLGTFEPRKNISGLLEGYRLLRERLPDAPPLVLAGNRGWMFDETMDKIARFGLRDEVLWRENVSQGLLPALYNKAVALVTPSFYEGFGLPALEAMASGSVPIVSNRGSLPEVVGEVGAQVDPDDPQALAVAMERALVDEAWRSAQVVAGLHRAALFTWESTARVVLSAYETVINL